MVPEKQTAQRILEIYVYIWVVHVFLEEIRVKGPRYIIVFDVKYV